MSVNDFKVIFYEKADGTIPVREFLDGLNVKMEAKLARAIAILSEKGNELREPTSKPLSDGIFELRAQVGTDISRVLYFFVVNRKIVLTHGFIKKTEKTPQSEIDKAKNYREDYLRRNVDDGSNVQ